MEKIIHHGRNVRRFREMLGIKQDGLAYDLGEDWNQKKVSALEQKDIIDDGLLEQVAALLKVPADAIRNFDEESAINFIGNTFSSHDQSASVNYNCTFNPLDKYIEAMEENKKLYERLLKSEEGKVSLMQKIIEGK